MPPKRAITTRSNGTRVSARAASREVVAESTHEVANQDEVVQPAVQQFDIATVRQIAQEAALEAARVAAQEVAHQFAHLAGPAVAPPVQPAAAPPVQPAAAPPAQPVQVDDRDALLDELMRYRERYGDQLQRDAPPAAEHVANPFPPPPPPARHYQVPSYWELMRQMRDMGLEKFGGSVDATAADNWKRMLERNLDHMRCPAEHRLDLATQYLKDDALVWWEGVVEGIRGRYELSYRDFQVEFSRKFFPREMLDKKENAFQDIRQGTRSVREYELEFSRLRRFAGRVMDEQELIRRFMKGLRADIRSRCSLVNYHSMLELVEKAAIQEVGLAEEQKLNRSFQSKQENVHEPQKRTLEHVGPPQCTRCYRHHFGECGSCHICGKVGHIARNCPQKTVFPVGSCFNCGQHGHHIKDCPKQGQQLSGPPPKRPATAPRVFAVGDHARVEPVVGTCLFKFSSLCLCYCYGSHVWLVSHVGLVFVWG